MLQSTSFKVQGGSIIAAFFLAHNYVSEQFGNYVEYGICFINFFNVFYYYGYNYLFLSLINYLLKLNCNCFTYSFTEDFYTLCLFSCEAL